MSSLQNGYFTSPTVASYQYAVPTNWTLVNPANSTAMCTISNPGFVSNTAPAGSGITQFIAIVTGTIMTTPSDGVYQDIVFPYIGYGTISFYTEKRVNQSAATGLKIWVILGNYSYSYNYTDTVWHYDSFNFTVDSNLTLRLYIQLTTPVAGDQSVYISGINIAFSPYPPPYPKIFDNSANAMTANYRNGLIFNSQLLVNNNSSFNSQQNNHSLDFISDQYYGEGYQNMTVAFSSTQNRIPIYRSITLPTFQKSTNFSASYLNGCFIWLDAADYYTYNLTSTSVNSWLDKSSSSVSLAQTGAAGLKPIYTANSLNGRSTLAFARASTQHLIKPSTLAIGTNSFAMFVVCKFNNLTDSLPHFVFIKTRYAPGSGRFGLYKESTNKIIAFIDRSGTVYPDGTGFTITSTGYNIYSLICNRVAGNDTVYYNGTSKISTTYVSDIATNITNTNDIIVGACNSVSGSDVISTANTYLDGGVAEVMCFRTPTDMTEATRQKIEGYLAWKWDLLANLPIGHPWLYEQPTFGLQT